MLGEWVALAIFTPVNNFLLPAAFKEHLAKFPQGLSHIFLHSLEKTATKSQMTGHCKSVKPLGFCFFRSQHNFCFSVFRFSHRLIKLLRCTQWDLTLRIYKDFTSKMNDVSNGVGHCFLRFLDVLKRKNLSFCRMNRFFSSARTPWNKSFLLDSN